MSSRASLTSTSMHLSRRHAWLPHALLALCASVASASADAFDCHVRHEGLTYDLTKAAGEFNAAQTRQTPPTKMVDSVRFNLCADLKILENVPQLDQCPVGTRVCLTQTNKNEKDPDRIIAVIPIVQSQNLVPEYTAKSTPKSLSIFIKGPEYPPSSLSPSPQSFNLTFLCDPDHASDPKFVAYDGSRLDIEWSGPAACPFKDDEKKDEKDKDKDKKGDDDKKEEKVGSGLGWFFLVLFLALAAYFGLGAYYNYTTYGARGMDLIPHRDFWHDVPYMLSDVVSHLCSSARPRSSSNRGGYIAV